MKQVKVTRYNDNVVFVEKGYRKHYLYFDNCDEVNAIIYFCVVMFDQVEITMDCDIQFWEEWLDFYCSTNGFIKDIEFTGSTVPILADKWDGFSDKPRQSNLMFTGGKDSTASKLLSPDANLMVFKAQHYKVSEDIKHVEFFSTNIDNELYHCMKSLRGKLQLELFFPLISRYSDTRMGIEKEVWEDPDGLLLYDMVKYQELLRRYGLNLDSPVKHLFSPDILELLKKHNLTFEKCGDEGFCYGDEKCLGLFIMGCNLEEHGFDREKYLSKYYKLAWHMDIHRTIDAIVKSAQSRKYFHNLVNKYWKGI